MCAAEAHGRSSFADDEMQRNASAESGVKSTYAVHWITVMYYIRGKMVIL